MSRYSPAAGRSAKAEVALRAGIERHTLNRIEGAHAAARLDALILILVLIADAVGVPLAQLVRE
ncbi:hypothetical protein ACFCYC_03470 [Streptomyces sp. NPDC056402]|uniref:hypothetical protein n=1 Tax=Streptomyces sp. NPDC056402 TaxID=3345810 RepID=UPI0035D68260